MKRGLRKTALLTAFAMLTLVFSTITAWAGTDPAIKVVSTNIYANGNAIVIAQGTSADYTLIYLDSNNDGVIDDIASPVAFTGPTGDTTDGYDLSIYTIYGGSESDPVTGTKITMAGGKVGTVYGGGYQGNVTGDTSVTISGGRVVYNVLGGGYSGNVTGITSIDMNGGTLNYIYGGGLYGICGSTSVKISGGTVNYSAFGGGNTDIVGGSTSVTMSGGTVNYSVFGGGNMGTVSSTSVDMSGGSVSQCVYGGGYMGTVNSTSVKISGGIVSQCVYGGGNMGTVSSASVAVSGGTVNFSVFGGGLNDTVTGNASVDMSGGIVSTVFGGGNTGTVSGDRTININGGTIESGISSESAYSSVVNLGTPKTIITGGSIQGGVSGVAPVNNENVPVYLTALPISGITAATPVAASSIMVAPSYYGKNGLVTDADGKLYFYLPAGVASVTCNSLNYTATVETVNTNVFTAPAPAPAPAPTPATEPEPEKIEQFIKDKDTGISIYSKSLPDNAWMKVTPVSLSDESSSNTSSDTSSNTQSGTIVAKFDMTVSSNFTGKATLSVPVGEEYNGKTLTVIFGSGDDAEEFTCVVGGGRITFTTTKYLSFMILDQSAMAGGTVSSEPVTEPVAIPDTGDTARLFPFALLMISGITAGAMLGNKKQA